MNKIFKSAALIIAIFALASCQKEFNPTQEEEAAEGRSFSASFVQTKAISNTGAQTFKAGETIDVWNVNTREIKSVVLAADNISENGKNVEFTIKDFDPEAPVLAVYPGGYKASAWGANDAAPHFACMNSKRDGVASAVCKSGEGKLVFKNLTSCLAFACPSGVSATNKFAYLYGNNGEKIPSQLFIDPTTGEASPYTAGTMDYAFTNLTVGYESEIRFWVYPGVEFTEGVTVKTGPKATEPAVSVPSTVPLTVGENEYIWLGAMPLTYGEETYKCKRFGNTVWMTENLRYIPSGSTAGTPGTEGATIFYPYSTDGTATTPLTDEASIDKFGYLYSSAAMTGETVSLDNVYGFEGTQGICPKGWHVPTRAEFLALCGNSNKDDSGKETGNVIKTDALFYDAAMGAGSVANFNNGGWNFVFSGSVINGAYNKTMITADKAADESFIGGNALNYYWTSTGYIGTSSTPKPQFFALMTTFTSANKGKVSLAYCAATNAAAVRCVMDNVQ